MKILLANVWLKNYGGSELWTYTMAKTLVELGHEVIVFTLQRGMFSDKHLDFVEVTTQPVTADLALVNHRPCYDALPHSQPIIYTSHSTFLSIERCPKNTICVAVSDEIKDIEADRGIKCEVIPNPIDFEMYQNKREPSNKLKTVVYLNHDHGLASHIINDACKRVGAKLLTIKKPALDLSDLINEADLAIGIGRCLLEAMACERYVISGDWRGWMKEFSGAGPINNYNFKKTLKDNFSGRLRPDILDSDKLVEYFIDYDPTVGKILRQKLITTHNRFKVAKEYLLLYERHFSN